LNQQRLVDPCSPYRLPAVHLVLALAHDVACAMLHLHSEQVVHSDLKAGNVLLTKANTQAPFTAAIGDSASSSRTLQRPDSCAALLSAAQAAAGGRLVAKVADFGLSLSLDPGSTHISHMHAVSENALLLASDVSLVIHKQVAGRKQLTGTWVVWVVAASGVESFRKP
jgi:serine/threonine protein kinase